MTHDASLLIAFDRLGAEIMAHITVGDKAKTKANEHYLAAGLRLVEARDRAPDFNAFLKDHCPDLKRSRAYQLISIAGGKTTVETERAKTAERMRKHRAAAKCPSRDGQLENRAANRPLRNGHGATIGATKPKRTTALDVIGAWMDMPESPEEDRRVFEAIGLRRILAALPEAWKVELERWVERRRSPSPTEIEIESYDLSIPAFLAARTGQLRRRRWA